MRYLVEAFVVGALRRGAEIEQFLGPKEHAADSGSHPSRWGRSSWQSR
ncbi:hypothetical protein [Streptomyces sp. CoT10]|nr:hypothetical protein [Streptomyces sp. CoT10]